MRRIMEQKDELVGQVSDLEADLDQLARDWRREQREAARALAEAAGSIRDNRLADKIRYSKGVVQQRTPEYARNFEEQIGADLEELRQLIEDAAGAVGENDEQRIGDLLEDTRGLVRDLESLDERIQERAEGQTGQRGEEQQGEAGGGGGGQQQRGGGGQQQQGNQGGGRPGQQQGQGQGQTGGGDGGFPRGGSTGGFGAFQPDDVRQFRGEFRERATELEALRQRMRREGIDISTLSDVLERLRRLDSRSVFDDPAEIARLQQAAIEGLKEFEYGLRRRFADPESDRLLLSGSDEVPQGFKELVEEYYRALSNRNR
jgi:outer membrane murein-binding lipoprotein Lpp